MSGEFIVIGDVGGYYDEHGKFIVCEEYGGTDLDFDTHAVDVQNGNGYYNSSGKYVPYSSDTYD